MAIRRRAWLLGLVLPVLVPAQASAQVAVNIQRYIDLETLYLADLVSYTAGRQPEFIGINLTTAGSRQVRLDLTLRRDRPSPADLLTGRTDPFTLEGTLRLTNRDLACESCPYGVKDGEISPEFEDLVYRSSRFPAGSYTLIVRVLTPTGVELGQGFESFELINPTRIELVSPGTPFGDTPELIHTPTPQFHWSSDAPVVSVDGQYRIRVVPVDEGMSPEDAMQQFATWEESTAATAAIYPASAAAIALVSGNTYAWQVEREVRSSTSTEVIESPIYWFRYAEPASPPEDEDLSPGGAAYHHMMLRLYMNAFGLSDVLDQFKLIGTVFINGLPGLPGGLNAILQALFNNALSPLDIYFR